MNFLTALYLKLHGSISLPASYSFGLNHETVFGEGPDRLQELTQFEQRLPIVFPWECRDFSPADCKAWDHEFPRGATINSFRNHFQGVWAKAFQVVQNATKISFIGISFHHYLHERLAGLFRSNTKKEVEFLCVDKANTVPQRNPGWERTPAGKLEKFLTDSTPFTPAHGEIRRLTSFEDFIWQEM